MNETILKNRYSLQKLLGRNTGRRTFLAEDLITKKLVVVKILYFNQDWDWDALKLFEREAQTLKSIFHFNIPRYLDFFEFEEDNTKGFALVQTSIEGQSLQECMDSGRHFSDLEVKEIAKSLLTILKSLHDRNPPVIHRDIKPSNILLNNRSGNSVGNIYLVDFGSVQNILAREGKTITIVGTYGYMPPEQFGGRTVPASDLYALGCTLIYLITGIHPADLPQVDGMIDLRQINYFDSSFIDWLGRMIHPSLSNRFTSAREAFGSLIQPAKQNLSPFKPSNVVGNSNAVVNQPQERKILVSKEKPLDSKIILNKYIDSLSVTIPPSNKFFFLILILSIFLSLLYLYLGYSLSFYSVSMLIIVLTTVFFIKSSFNGIIFEIDEVEISLKYKFWCFQRNITPPTIKSNISKIEYIHDSIEYIYYQNYDSTIPIKSNQNKLRIVAGDYIYEIGLWKNPKIRLSNAEVKWLAYEISDWLGIPITEVTEVTEL